jgi:hypothetical protein
VGIASIGGSYQPFTFTISSGTFLAVNISAVLQVPFLGINDAGDIAGTAYSSDRTTTNGFVFAGGIYTVVDFPRAGLSGGSGVNNLGQIVGVYSAPSAPFGYFGFVATLSVAATLSPTSLNFGNQSVGSTTSPQIVTLTNTGSEPLTISSIAASGDFGETNACGSSLAAGQPA